jgi:hypothetical protein
VDRLGYYPKRFKTPTTDKERAENSLAKNISKQWSKLNDATKAKLTRLQQETQSKNAELEQQVKDAELEQQVEQLGHYPKRFKTPTTDKERVENSLAEKICKQWSQLSDATKAKLTRLQQETQSKACSSSAAQPASKKRTLDTDPSSGASGSAARPATLSEQVEQQVDRLGHYPKRFKTPTTDKERAENSLAKNISTQWSKLNDATKAKLTRLQQETQSKHAEKQAERRAEDT